MNNKDQILRDLVQKIIEHADDGTKEMVSDNVYQIENRSKNLIDSYNFLKNELDNTGSKLSKKRAPRVPNEWYG